MFVINENGHFVLTGGLFTNQGEQPDQRGLQFHTVVAVKDVRSVIFVFRRALMYQLFRV